MPLNTIRLLAVKLHSQLSTETYSNYMLPGNTLDNGEGGGPKVC